MIAIILTVMLATITPFEMVLPSSSPPPVPSSGLVEGVFPPLPPSVSPPAPEDPYFSSIITEHEELVITGTITNGWDGHVQNVSLTIPAHDVSAYIADELFIFVKGIWEWFIVMDYWVPISVIGIVVIAIFTMQKREVRL